jgi:acyl dehydratase
MSADDALAFPDAKARARIVKAAEVAALIGREVGVSEWVAVDQARIDAFADCSEDHQFIHVDPERAARETPFGGAIAHGFLTLSMLSRFGREAGIRLEGFAMGVNYGLDRARFLQPVRAGSRARGRFTLAEARERRPGQWLLSYDVTVEIEGEDKPALVARWLTMQVLDAAGEG